MSADNAEKTAESFINGFTVRRTVYDLGNELPVGKDKIVKFVQEAVKHIPTSFNNQGNRAVILFGEEHKKFWEEGVWRFISGAFPEDKLGYFESKIKAFKNSAGTVLFFVDTKVIDNYREQSKAYRDAFPVWAEQSSGMLQFAVWSTLASANIGASLQHYNDVYIERYVKNMYSKIQSPWKLISQMPFGNILAPPGDKTIVPIEETVLVFD